MSLRYGVLRARPEGADLIEQTASLEVALRVANENPLYELYDYHEHKFVPTEAAPHA